MPSQRTFHIPAADPGEPAYTRIKRWIVDCVGSGAMKSGEQVPSEAELTRIFKVSRMTAHRALRELSADRVVRRVQGMGTFVTDGHHKFTSTVVAIPSIHAEIEARGHRHSCKVLKRETVPLEQTKAVLDLPGSTPIFHLMVLHFEDDKPIQLEDRYVNPAIAPLFLKQRFATVAPGDYLKRVAPIARAEHRIEAVMPPPQVARQLRQGKAEPCLVLTRSTWSRNQPATFARLFYPGSRYLLTAEVVAP